MSMAISFIFISAIALIYFMCRRKDKGFDVLFDKIPSPPCMPVVGHLLRFSKLEEMLNTLGEMLVENGGVVAIRVGPWMRFVFVSDLDTTITLCTSNQVQKSQTVYRMFEDWLGVMILNAEGELWKKYRSLITPLVHFAILEQYIQTYNSTSRILIENMKTAIGTTVNVYKHVELWSINTVLETSLELPLHVLRNPDSEHANSIRDITRIITGRLFNPLKYNDFLFRFTRDYWKQRRAIRFLREQTKFIMEQKVSAENKRFSEAGSSKKRAKSFLDLIHESRGNDLSDEEICNHLQALLFAGYDTSATVVSCALYLLSLDEGIQEKAYSEIKSVFNGKGKMRGCTLEDLQKMSYLEMVIKETMRLYPPVPFLAKHTLEDLRIKNHVIPKGCDIFISIDSIHRNEHFFPNPHVFDPERFTPENQVNIKPFTYIPFSAGPRNCVGQRASMFAMKIVLSMVLWNYKLLPAEGFQLKLLPHVILKPSDEGVQLRLQEREN